MNGSWEIYPGLFIDVEWEDGYGLDIVFTSVLRKDDVEKKLIRSDNFRDMWIFCDGYATALRHIEIEKEKSNECKEV